MELVFQSLCVLRSMFISPLTFGDLVPNMNQPAGTQHGLNPPRSVPGKATDGLMADKLAFFQLPPLLQSELKIARGNRHILKCLFSPQSAFPICQKEPIMCASLANNMDKQQLATVLGVSAPAVGKSKCWSPFSFFADVDRFSFLLSARPIEYRTAGCRSFSAKAGLLRILSGTERTRDTVLPIAYRGDRFDYLV